LIPAVASSATIFSVIMKAYCEAILDIVLRALDQSIDSEEVANMAVYAASLQASATTGAAPRVDGGVIETIT